MSTSNFTITNHSITRRSIWGWGLIIFSVFALFRLPGLGVPLASDELASVSLWAQMPYLKIFSNYQYPNNHIFLTLILSFLLKTFGLIEWLLRVPVLACGLASLFLTYQIGEKLSGNSSVGLFTAFLLAISERHIFFSTNARGYMLVMVLALIAVTCALNQMEYYFKNVEKQIDGFNGFLTLLGWVSIWVLGTWTIPTFLFFQVSLAIFLLAIMLTVNQTYHFQKLLVTLPLLSVAIGCVGFYFQYYILIDPLMLAEASSHAAKSSLQLFFPKLLDEWVSPFESAGFLFFIFALVGLRSLFHINRIACLLMVCICVGPVTIGIAGFLFGVLPGVPHSRTYFYLQPFFLILGVMGVQGVAVWFLKAFKQNSEFFKNSSGTVTAVLAGVLFLVAGLQFYKKNYPLRLSRPPLHKVHEFIQKLNPNDLLLASHNMHVEVFLYGAREIRTRVDNILREGKLGNIYFLDYEKNSRSKIEKSKLNKFIEFPVLTENAGKEGPAISDKALEKVEQFGPFTFFKLKKDWLQPLKGWRQVGLNLPTSGNESFRWERSPSGNRPLIRFENSFTVAMENRESVFRKDSGITLNLMEKVGRDGLYSSVLLGGAMEGNDIEFDPSWLANAWILSHPYGSNIYNRPWNPEIFISQGAGHLSVLDVKYTQAMGRGALKNFLSYRISDPEG